MAEKLLPLIPMLALLAWAAIEDIRTRRIRNWLTMSLVISGIARSFLAGSTLSPSQALLGMAVGFAVPFVLFAMGGMGAGDVKLLAGIGAWMGLMPVLGVMLVEAIVGMGIVLIQCGLQGKLLALFKNSALLTINLMHVNDVGVKHVCQTGKGFRSIDRPLPYAVPVLAATLIVIVMM